MLDTLTSEDPTMTVVGYIRHSKAEQGKRMSPALQRRAIEAWAADHGQTVDQWFRDSAPGSTPVAKRQGLQDALATLEPGSMIIVYRLDRLSRDLELQLRLFRLVAAAGARIISTMDEGTNGNGDADDPDAEFIRQLQGALAQRERGVLARRIRDGVHAKRAAGRRWCRDAPYGSRWAPDGTIREKASEQRTIQLVHQLRSDGMSYRSIIDQLKRGRRFNRAGQPFNLSAVQKLVKTGRD